VVISDTAAACGAQIGDGSPPEVAPGGVPVEEEERWRKVCVDGTIVEIPRGGYMSVTRGVESDSGFQVLVDPRVVGA